MATDADISRAAETLRRGGLVAFPTETVYGLGADADNAGALARLYAFKGRPGELQDSKRAVVTLEEGHRIDVTTGL